MIILWETQPSNINMKCLLEEDVTTELKWSSHWNKILVFMNPLGETVIFLTLMKTHPQPPCLVPFHLLLTWDNMVRFKNIDKNGEMKWSLNLFPPQITKPLYINYSFEPTIISKVYIFHIINILILHVPPSYIIICIL